MIEAFTGFPGSGKTFALTNEAYKAMKQGQTVFTNYPVKGAYKITFDDLVNYTFPSGCTVIIDEAGRYFNSRAWSKLPPEIFDLFTLHRHMKLDLKVGVQNFQRIDVALREVIELVWWARNYSMLPVFIYDGYFSVENLGMKGKADKRMMKSKFSRSRKLYDTHAMRTAVNKDLMPLIPWASVEDDASEGGEDSTPDKGSARALLDRVRGWFRLKGNQDIVGGGLPAPEGLDLCCDKETLVAALLDVDQDRDTSTHCDEGLKA